MLWASSIAWLRPDRLLGLRAPKRQRAPLGHRAEQSGVTNDAAGTSSRRDKAPSSFGMVLRMPQGDQEEIMERGRDFLVLVTLAAAAATPALGQAPTAVPSASSAAQGAASIPDFSGIWSHPSFPGF